MCDRAPQYFVCTGYILQYWVQIQHCLLSRGIATSQHALEFPLRATATVCVSTRALARWSSLVDLAVTRSYLASALLEKHTAQVRQRDPGANADCR